MARTACLSAAKVTTQLLLTFFAFSALATTTASQLNGGQQQQIYLPPQFEPPTHRAVDLQLRHVFHHGTRKHPNLHRRLDVQAGSEIWMQEEDSFDRLPVPRMRVDTQSTHIQRLADRSPARVEALQDAGRARGSPLHLPMSAWTVDEIRGPNYTDKETVLSFARIAANAYIPVHGTEDWREVGGGFNYTEDFGWELDGIRGHIFADTENRTIVVGLKGTSPAIFDGQATTTKDKINDNLFFSCCCGQGGSVRWLNVCDCRSSTYTCNSTCLRQNLQDKDHYYEASKNLYSNVTALYPDADIYLAGHSLGGALCSFLGLTYGLPVMTFGAPGDAMPAARLGLPVPPSLHIGSDGKRASTGGYHFGHTADPIYQGTCSGWSSTCSIAGYAMESLCHTGLECVYDVVRDKGWYNNMANHRIAVTLGVIESYENLAECAPVEDCTDCYLWKYYESNSSQTTTSASTKTSSFTQTRTATCLTPGWWGCLDETTTSGPTITSKPTTTTTSTSTCKTPGWFGCKDPTTTTAKTESTPTTSPTTCNVPIWPFCEPPVSTASRHTASASASITATPAPTRTASAPTKSAPSSSCQYPGLFWGCHDTGKPSRTHSLGKSSTSKNGVPSSSCVHPGIFGECWDLWGSSGTGVPQAGNGIRDHGL